MKRRNLGCPSHTLLSRATYNLAASDYVVENHRHMFDIYGPGIWLRQSRFRFSTTILDNMQPVYVPRDSISMFLDEDPYIAILLNNCTRDCALCVVSAIYIKTSTRQYLRRANVNVQFGSKWLSGTHILHHE